MIHKWLTDSIYARRHFKAGDAELTLMKDRLCWGFHVKPGTPPLTAHRVEFSFDNNPDSTNKVYSYHGRFLVPSSADLSIGNLIVMQWHGQDGSGEFFALQITDEALHIYPKFSGETAIDLLGIPLRRNVWIEVSGEYRWDKGEHKGVVDGAPFQYKGRPFESMYWKYGCYRTGHLDGDYPAFQIYWSDCEKTIK